MNAASSEAAIFGLVVIVLALIILVSVLCWPIKGAARHHQTTGAEAEVAPSVPVKPAQPARRPSPTPAPSKEPVARTTLRTDFVGEDGRFVKAPDSVQPSRCCRGSDE